MVVVRQLQNAGYSTIEARDGSDAIKRFAERRDEISAVLLDLVMPNTSGGETLTMLRYYVPDLPVVITSEAIPNSDALSLSRAPSSRCWVSQKTIYRHRADDGAAAEVIGEAVVEAPPFHTTKTTVVMRRAPRAPLAAWIRTTPSCVH